MPCTATMEDRFQALAYRSIHNRSIPVERLRLVLARTRTGSAVLRWSRRDTTIRGLNLVAAVTSLVISAPLMLVIAAVIKLTSRGPIFYTQTRIGLDRRTPGDHDPGGRRRVDQGGRPFRIFKFRTMTVDSDRSGQVWATPDDPRVTRIGRVLRRYRLDELPQLFNVLRGDMNLVGPRPEQPDLFVQLRDKVERYQERQRTPPGITGWAQINHSYDGCLEDVKKKVQLDLEYLEQRSVRRDLEIMLKTLPVMVFRKGAW